MNETKHQLMASGQECKMYQYCIITCQQLAVVSHAEPNNYDQQKRTNPNLEYLC